jgi:hypothetical protein
MQQFTRLEVICCDSLPLLESRKFDKASNWAIIAISWWGGGAREAYQILFLAHSIDEII